MLQIFLIMLIFILISYIINLRNDNNFGQKQIAIYLNISRRDYCNIEVGRRKLNIDEAIKLCYLYGKSFEYICGYINDDSILLNVDMDCTIKVLKKLNVDIEYYHELRSIVIKNNEILKKVTQGKF